MSQEKEQTKTSVWDDSQFKPILKEIERTFGKNVLFSFHQSEEQLKLQTIDSGSLLINSAIGTNGYPKGRITEIFGPESSGKTTLSLHAIAEVQKQGGVAAFIDAEHALDPKYAQKIGVNLENLLVSQPENGEQALDLLEALIKTGVIDLIVIDSVAALVPKAELEGEMSDQGIGLQARLMSKALRKVNGIIAKTNTAVIFINQVREKVGVVFGNPEITSGGRALRFYASLRLETRKGEAIQKDGELVGNKVRFKVVKNKVAAQFKTVMLTLHYNQGLDFLSEAIELATQLNIFSRSGTWYAYQEEKLGQGKEQVRQWMVKNPQRTEEIVALIKTKMNFVD